MTEMSTVESLTLPKANEIPIHFIWIGKAMPKMICKCFVTLANVYKENPIYFWSEPSVFENGNGLGQEYLDNQEYVHDDEVSELFKQERIQIKNVHVYDNHRIFKECTFPYQVNKYRTLQPNLRYDTLSDAYRYAILEEYGGLYVDSDFYHFKSYADVLAQHDAALGQCDQIGRHGNGFLYVSTPNHPFIKEIIDVCISRSDIAFHRLAQIGPGACYKARNKLIHQGYDVFSVPYDLFFAFNWEDTDGICCTAQNENRQPEVIYYADMYAVHLWYDVFSYWSNHDNSLEYKFKEIQRESDDILAQKKAIIQEIDGLYKKLYQLGK